MKDLHINTDEMCRELLNSKSINDVVSIVSQIANAFYKAGEADRTAAIIKLLNEE